MSGDAEWFERSTAFHEAAHAVLAVKSFGTVGAVTIVASSTFGGVTYVTPGARPEAADELRLWLERQVMVSLAGHVAAELSLANGRNLAHLPEHTRERITTTVTRAPASTEDLAAGPALERKDIAARAIDPGADEKVGDDADAWRLLCELYPGDDLGSLDIRARALCRLKDQTREALVDAWPAVEAVAAGLLAKKTLSGLAVGLLVREASP